MERNFDNKDFEQFLKQNADQYRMHPSEKVWTEINNTLHPRRRWYGIAALLLLLTGSVVSGVMILQPGSNSQTVSTANKTKSQPAITENKTASAPSVPVLTNINPNRSVASYRIPTIINNYSAEKPGEIAESSLDVTMLPVLLPQQKVERNIAPSAINNNSDLALKTKNTITVLPVITSNNEDINNISELLNNNLQKSNPASEILTPSIMTSDLMTKTPETGNSSQKTKKKKTAIWQLYFTPGISYRRLTENKQAILAASGTSSIPSNLAVRDVKNLVIHKPDIGFELGLAAKYTITKHFLLKAGFQFNVNKYNIHAFNYVAEPATIAIQTGGAPQSVTSTSYYRNFNGYSPNWLTNIYFSLSVPVGLELNLVNNNKINIGLGLTAQPTYLLDNKAYLISTDFKNYTKVPDLIRRWNLNTGAELIFGFKAGKTKFQIGPQMRYQALSSFKDKYPVKENLFNFGLKAGVSLNR
jgi:hypothetical protein